MRLNKCAPRLYFTNEETEFMKEYYLRTLEKMKNNLGTK